MNKILAINDKGILTYCTADEEHRNKGRCNHKLHQTQNESVDNFIKRIAEKNDVGITENLILKERKEKKLELYKKEKMGHEITGNQIKYFKNNNYIKLDEDKHNNGLSEEISSIFLDYTNLEHAQYKAHSFYMGELNSDMGINCVSSPNFLKEGEQLFSFHEVISSDEYKEFEKEKNILKQFNILTKIINNNTGLDCKNYLLKILSIDLLIYNPDRHLNNISLIKDIKGKWKFAPCYDNGLALLSNYKKFPLFRNEKDNCFGFYCKTFNSKNLDDYINLIKNNQNDILQIDYEKFIEKIENYENLLYDKKYVERSKNILITRLKELEGIVWINKI